MEHFIQTFFLHDGFRQTLNRLVERLPLARRFKPRLYTYADYLLVKFYAVAKGCSVHSAAEDLNRQALDIMKRTFRKDPRPFADGRRKRRLVPHQTEVDKFLRLLMEDENTIHDLFGNFLMETMLPFITTLYPSREVKAIVDNTEVAYYGKQRDDSVIGTHRPHMGTKKCRLLQGMSIEVGKMHFFTGFRLLRKGQYRSKHIGVDLEWLRFNGLKVKVVLLDREFYRANLIHELKRRHFSCLIPAKKFQKVKKELKRYLYKQRAVVESYRFSQKTGAKPFRASTRLHLVVVGHAERSAKEIRTAFYNQQCSHDEALSQLAGFFTTLPPWKNKNAWARWLMKLYKRRWRIETGYGDLNPLRGQFRPHRPEAVLLNHYILAFWNNLWQADRNIRLQRGDLARDCTAKETRNRFAGLLERSILKQISVKLSMMNWRERRRYC